MLPADPQADEPAASPDSHGPGPRSLSATLTSIFIPLGLAAISVLVLWKKDVIGPGSFRRRAPRRLGPWPWFIWLAAAFLVYLAAQIGGGLTLAVMGPGLSIDSLKGMALLGVGSYTAAIAASLALARLLAAPFPAAPLPTEGGAPSSSPPSSAAPARAEGFRVRPIDLPRGLLGLLLTYPLIYAASSIAVAITTLLHGSPPAPIAHKSLQLIIDHHADGWAWALAAAATVGAPFVEEMIYRVFLQSAFLRVWGSAWPAIVTTAALFALMHLGAVEPHALPALFVLGVGLGVAYERARSPLVPITMHAAFNAINIALALLFD